MASPHFPGAGHFRPFLSAPNQLADSQELISNSIPTLLISCHKAPRTFFTFGNFKPAPNSEGAPFQFYVIGEDETVAGVVVIQHVTDPLIAREMIGQECELVGISTMDAVDENGTLRSDGRLYRFREGVNVLWIEWKDGIAYRRGLGVVDWDRWKVSDRDEIDLILG
jgi:hypothetical protein